MLKKGVSRAADGKAGEEMQMEVVSCTKQAKTLTARQHRSYVVFHLPGLQQSICSMQKLSVRRVVLQSAIQAENTGCPRESLWLLDHYHSCCSQLNALPVDSD
ncbi:uncharacterized protein LOC120282341 isoform X1 [Dioscorea cayenensis subsp. rotundata]|uniref:Uncharacterized protein LOC120282341 isoform X1 n=1 Tax=Dioscorea cayennensis subsp. rotundata TaxID=55577 RepID=A0AB40CYJ0_DIOCR|nr:uncharacterized protein LOC120282341 isoform X1 [Dioscorea cayenensis subsp. rotundata]